MTINTIKFDPACYLNSEERIAAYLEETLENGTQEDFVKALDTVARARGMTDLDRKTGIGRESLYKTLSSEKPRFETILKIIHARGALTRPYLWIAMSLHHGWEHSSMHMWVFLYYLTSVLVFS